ADAGHALRPAGGGSGDRAHARRDAWPGARRRGRTDDHSRSLRDDRARRRGGHRGRRGRVGGGPDMSTPAETILAGGPRLRTAVIGVGYLGRVHAEKYAANPAAELDGIVREPRFIECHRLAPFTERGTDVDVVLDLMIHDLDVILSMMPSPLRSVEAVGVPVLTNSVDIANARLRFANGGIANVTASRVSLKRERKLRIFQPDAYLSVDYGERRVLICRRESGPDGLPALSLEEREVPEA